MDAYYQIIIKDNQYNSYKKIASLLFFITGLFFLLKGIRMNLAFDKGVLFGASFILFVYSAYMWIYKIKGKSSYILIYLLAIIVWVLEFPYWYISFVYLVLLGMHYMLEKDFIIRITSNNIQVQGWMKKIYAWKEFNNIVLKDGLLTLDFKNNRVMQVEPDREKTTITEKEFNEFCSSQLSK